MMLKFSKHHIPLEGIDLVESVPASVSRDGPGYIIHMKSGKQVAVDAPADVAAVKAYLESCDTMGK